MSITHVMSRNSSLVAQELAAEAGARLSHSMRSGPSQYREKYKDPSTSASTSTTTTSASTSATSTSTSATSTSTSASASASTSTSASASRHTVPLATPLTPPSPIPSSSTPTIHQERDPTEG